MNIIEVVGKAGNTFSELSTDSAQDLDTDTTLAFKDSDDRLLTSLFIQVQDNDLRFCYGSTPEPGGLGMVLSVGQTLYLKNPANIRALEYISNVAGDHATLMITPFYGNK